MSEANNELVSNLFKAIDERDLGTSAKIGQLAGRYRAGSIKHNLERAASALIAQERVISRATDLGMLADMAKIPRELPRYLQAATRPGTFLGDVLRANDQGATEMDRPGIRKAPVGTPGADAFSMDTSSRTIQVHSLLSTMLTPIVLAFHGAVLISASAGSSCLP